MKRALLIARATLQETLRSGFAWCVAVALVAATPILAWLFGDDAATRAWLVRLIASETMRVLMPLAAIFGGAFLLRPTFKAGWAVLPARRLEWFAGGAMAGAAILLLGAMAFVAGAAVAGWMFGAPLSLMAQAESAQAATMGGEMALAHPGRDESIAITPPAKATGAIRGTVEYTPVLTGDQAPSRRSPVALYVETAGKRVPLEVEVQARRRVGFTGAFEPQSLLILEPTDPALIIGVSPGKVKFELGTQAGGSSLFALFVMSVAASLLCLCVVLAMRGLSTAPTAALAGMLLLAALTLLPALVPAEAMARDRRRDLGQGREKGTLESLGAELSGLPQLFPDRYFDEYLAGNVVPAGTARDGLIRAGFALLLLAPGAWLFTRRQIAK